MKKESNRGVEMNETKINMHDYRKVSDEEARQILFPKQEALEDAEMCLNTLSWWNIEKTVKSLARLLIELKEDSSSYDTILSDDISGRLPALFLKQIIDRKKASEGKNATKFRAIAAGKGLKDSNFEAIREYIKNGNEKESWGKVLVVTDYICSGKSMGKLVDILEELDIDFDIAAVTVWDKKEAYVEPDSPEDVDTCNNPRILEKLRYGEIEHNQEKPPFYSEHHKAGLTRNKNIDTHTAHASAKPIEKINPNVLRRVYPEKAVELGKKKQARTMARKELNDLADKLYWIVE